jgi:hypothetical protein
MITSLLLYLITLFISLIVLILPSWEVWPDSLLTGLTYFFGSITKFNFIFPVDSLFAVIIFIINFEVLYLTAKLVMKIFNYIRGAGSGLDI